MTRRPPELKMIKQLNRSSGCGPACVAMVSGVSYEEAVFAIFGEHRTRSLWTDYCDLRRGLRKLNEPHARQRRFHRQWETISGISIVKCDLKRTNKWHWVVYDSRTGLLFDPLKDHATTPRRKRRISSHLPVWLGALGGQRTSWVRQNPG